MTRRAPTYSRQPGDSEGIISLGLTGGNVREHPTGHVFFVDKAL